MTEQALDRLVRRVMLDAARLEYGALPEEPPEPAFSPVFERKMKKLLRRGRHPVWHRTLHAAACVLLALILSGCAVLAVSQEAREAFAGWVREVYETAFVYRYTGPEQTEPCTDGDYEITWLPEGDWEEERPDLAGMGNVLYRNSAGELVVLAYTMEPEAFSLTICAENAAAREVRVNGRPADLYLDSQEGNRNLIVWTEEETGQLFCVSGPQGGEELVKMAESVRRVQSAVYRPSWVPEGYVEVSADDLGGQSVLTYRNGEGGLLTISYGYGMPAPSQEEGVEVRSVSVGETRADLYLDRVEGRASSLVWVDGDSGVSFRVSGPFDGGELIRIGESLERFLEPPLEERRLAWVPAGYREYDRVRMDTQSHVRYQNDEGDLISFGYHRGLETSGLYVIPSGKEELNAQTVLVNGEEADLYLDEGAASGLVWTEDGLLFSLLGYCSAEELVAMAESVEVISPDRRPAWVPEGYAMYERSFLHSDACTVTIYENQEGGTMIFRCQPNGGGRLYLVPNEGSVEKHVFVNGHPADLYSAAEPGIPSEMCWSDGEALYYLAGDLPDGEMLKTAESVQKMPPLPATHIPTWLPLGYRNTGARSGLWSVEAEYENGDGERICFRFARRGPAGASECLEDIREALEGLEGQDVLVDGCPGRLYPDGGGNHLIWGPEGAEEVYWLSGPLSGEVLMEIAGRVNRTAE